MQRIFFVAEAYFFCYKNRFRNEIIEQFKDREYLSTGISSPEQEMNGENRMYLSSPISPEVNLMIKTRKSSNGLEGSNLMENSRQLNIYKIKHENLIEKDNEQKVRLVSRLSFERNFQFKLVEYND